MTIHRGVDHRSRLLLPVVPSKCQESIPGVDEDPPLAPCAASLAAALGATD